MSSKENLCFRWILGGDHIKIRERGSIEKGGHM
jgi:hypothetical protein